MRKGKWMRLPEAGEFEDVTPALCAVIGQAFPDGDAAEPALLFLRLREGKPGVPSGAVAAGRAAEVAAPPVPVGS